MKNKKISMIKILPIICIVAITVVELIYISIYGKNTINADFSSEFVLAKLISNNKFFITNKWYYSSELRVLHTQLITAPLFWICNNWDLVRTLSIIITNILLAFAYLKFISIFNIKSRIIVCFSMVCMILPLSSVYIDIINVGMFYIPNLIMQLFLMHLFLDCIQHIKCNNKNKCYYLKIVLLFILALISGISGVRYILVFQIPLFLSVCILFIIKNPEFLNYHGECSIRELWSKALFKNEIYLGIGSMLFSGIGYILNTFVIRKFIKYAVFGNVMYKTNTEHIFDVFQGLFEVWGYNDDVRMLSVTGLLNLFSIALLILYIYIIVILLKNNFKTGNNISIICMVFLISFIINSLIFLITDEYSSRYFLPITMWLVPCMAIYLDSEKRPVIKYFVLAFLMISYLALSINAIKNTLGDDVNKDREGYIKYMEMSGYEYGYSTYWNTTITTELSNGKVEVANIKDFETMEPEQFLTKPMYFKDKSYHANEAVFILLSVDEYEQYGQSDVILKGTKVYADDYYIILEYNNRSVIDYYTDVYLNELE